MENYLNNLNEQQNRAVTTDSQYVRVIAGAGSGKTRVLTTRIVHIVNNWGVDPRKVLAITFTNKATNEMRNRINSYLPEVSGMIHISTIHSFCVMVLRQDIKHMGYPSNFTILDQDDQKSIIKEAFKALDIDSKKYNMAGILDYIASMMYAGIDGPSAISRALNYFEKGRAQIYDYYMNRKHELYALDFDDLLLWTNNMFKKFPEVRAKWQKRYQFILVDEFQDIDASQYELINLLATESTYIYVVGDPDQTIYTWRGADINIIMNFEKDYKPCETVVLERNYRSTSNILGAANSLIKYNRNRVKKDLYTENEEGSKITHYKAASESDEAYFVARKILELTKGAKYDFDDIAILYRSNYLSRAIETALMDYKIPYVIYGGIRFYERQEIKDSLSYLRMLTGQDDLAFKRIINVPKRGIGSKTVDYMLETARANNTSMYEAAKTIELAPKARKVVDALIAQIEDWKKRSKEMELEKILQMILEESGYRNMLETSEDPKDEERLENLKELIGSIYDFGQQNPESTLEDYLQMVTLYTDIQLNRDGHFVSLMTVHAAKGLEFPNVFVIGLSEGVFPSNKSLEDGIKGLEEERRLAYVAFTRAKENLFLTESLGYSFVASAAKITSRFLEEIDDQFIKKMSDSLIQPKLFEEKKKEPLPQIKRPNRAMYRKGDLVEHDDFGEGVIVDIDGNFGDIAFAYPFGTKTISLNFPKLHKKEKH